MILLNPLATFRLPDEDDRDLANKGTKVDEDNEDLSANKNNRSSKDPGICCSIFWLSCLDSVIVCFLTPLLKIFLKKSKFWF